MIPENLNEETDGGLPLRNGSPSSTPETDAERFNVDTYAGNYMPERDPEGQWVHFTAAQKMEIERDMWKKEAEELAAAFGCFRCGDHHTPLYCRNCADEMTSAENAPV